MGTTNEMHLFALHLVYIPLVNAALDELRCYDLSFVCSCGLFLP